MDRAQRQRRRGARWRWLAVLPLLAAVCVLFPVVANGGVMARYRAQSPMWARFWCACGLAPDQPDHHGDTPLVRAARHSDSATCVALIACGANPDRADGQGTLPLAVAVATGDREVAALLLTAGADPDRHDRSAGPPVHLAVARGDSLILEMLLSAGADPNIADSRGASPLCTAVECGKDALGLLLLEHGADPLARMPDGSALAEAAESRGSWRLAALLRAEAQRREPGGNRPPDIAPDGGRGVRSIPPFRVWPR